jgi:hypothetical protein
MHGYSRRLFSNRLHMQDSSVGLGRKKPYLGLKGLLFKPRNDRLTSGILENMFYFEYMSIILK